MRNEIKSFEETLAHHGFRIRESLIPDGKLHRFHVDGDKPGSKNGFYVLYGSGVPAGCFGSWKTGDTIKWCAKPDLVLTRVQREQNRRRMIEAQKAREAEETERRKVARNKAMFIWKSSPQAPCSHPYLIKKGVKSHGLRLYKELLVLALRDNDENIHSLQFIDGEGNKRFLSGGLKKGCYFLIGKPVKSLCVAEGYATAATIYESTGLPVAVAFDAGNLLSVTQALRRGFPDIKIILCADNDADTPGNPGVTKAREAAISIGGFLAIPPRSGDFNDIFGGDPQ